MKEVSIIIPSFNRSFFLRNFSIPSVIKQTFENWEIIVVDDGSTDDTEVICKEFADKDSRIRYIKEKNKGPSSARNLGIREAKGEFVLLLDSDDILMPNALEELLREQKKNNCDIVYSDVIVIKLKDKIFSIEGLDRGGIIPTSNFYRKSLFFTFCFFDESLRNSQDVDLLISWKRSKRYGLLTIKKTEEPLMFYLVHSLQTTRELSGETKKFFYKMLYKYMRSGGGKYFDGLNWIFCMIAHYEMLSGNKKEALIFSQKAFNTRRTVKNILFIISIYFLNRRLYSFFFSLYKKFSILIARKTRFFHSINKYGYYRQLLNGYEQIL